MNTSQSMKLLTPLLYLATVILAGADISFQGVLFNSPGRITSIGVTYNIPTTPREPSSGTQQGFWMGLQPGTGPSAVLQNVVGNLGTVVGEWDLFPEYCCNPNVFLHQGQKVYAGDRVVNNLNLDLSSGHWIDTWSVYRGSHARGAPGFSGSLVFKPELYPRIYDFSMAMFTVELGPRARWDFGPVVFENIAIVADGKDTRWCTLPVVSQHSTFWSVSQPMAVHNGRQVTCCVGRIALNGP